MNTEEHIQYWLKSASHDLKSADTLFNNKRYDWCLYLGHLVLEKTLKAIWLKHNKNAIPPKTHNLVKLAEETSLDLEDKKNCNY